MAERIRLVQGDTFPAITLTLRKTNGSPVDVSESSTVVRIYFRATGTDTVLSTITCSKFDPDNGVVKFGFYNNELDVEPGSYEGEVEVDFDGDTQTLYEVLKFQVRAEFA
jgi:hypothetical protein